VFDFSIVAFAIFLIVKTLAMARRRVEHTEEKSDKKAEPSREEALLTEIRDLLKQNQSEKQQ
jgi:large conductance mechanosensitive channel